MHAAAYLVASSTIQPLRYFRCWCGCVLVSCSVNHRHQKAALLLQGAQAAQKARDHGYAAGHQQQVGGGEGGKRQRQGGELGLGEGQPHADTKQTAAAELHARGGRGF